MNVALRIAALALAVLVAGCASDRPGTANAALRQHSLRTLDQASQLGSQAD